MENGVAGNGAQYIYSVSQITDKIKSLLEDNFPFIWISGEISNFSSPMSGHFYFSLKDENAQISAVMFRGQNRNLKFAPGDGMAVTGLGRISLYKPRGTYQIIFEYLEPRGIGALQVAFEQLKARLSGEGLFDEARKRPLPYLPQKIALVTSPTGAVLHDMIKITRRRFENMGLVVVPVKVQGPGAVEEIVAAIELVNRWRGADVIVLARGGGSLEDLQAFNSEAVARAIAGSDVPTVSAVGHETDYTISDFTADLRAPTPSAAAEMVVPQKEHLTLYIADLTHRLRRNVTGRIAAAETDIRYLSDRLADPVKRVQEKAMRCDELSARLFRSFKNEMIRQKEHLGWQTEKLKRAPLLSQITQYDNHIGHTRSVLVSSFSRRFENIHAGCKLLNEKLHALSPLSILDRGYSITRTATGKKIVSSQEQVHEGQPLEIILSRGGLEVSVTGKMDLGNTTTRLE